MRWLLLVILLMPMVSAHGDADHGQADVVGFLVPGRDLNHIQSAEVTLAPGESGNYSLSFSGGPFKAGWHWLLRMDVEEGSVRVRPFVAEQPLGTYHWGEGAHVQTAVLPVEGTMRLSLSNTADSNTTVRLYYDQSCECQYKRVPLRNGPVWFNIYAEEGQRVSWDFTLQPIQLGAKPDVPIPATVDVGATHMAVDKTDLLLSYNTLERTRVTLNATDAQCRQGVQWNGCFTLEFIATETGQQLVWFDVAHQGDASWTYMILPLADVSDPEQGMPTPWFLVLAALALAYRRAT